MLKSEASTNEENFTFSLDTTNNEASLLQLVKNLELELGYHAIALRKAEKMIEILKSDNQILRNENELFKNKCQTLSLQTVKLKNEIHRLLDDSYSYNNIDSTSQISKTKLEALHVKKQQNNRESNSKTLMSTTNLEKKSQISETPILNKKDTIEKHRETSFGYLLQDSVETSPGKSHKPKYAQEIFLELKRKCEKGNKHQEFEHGRIVETLSFIPFEEFR